MPCTSTPPYASPQEAPAFSPDTVVVSDRGVRYRIVATRWSRTREGLVTRGEAAFAAQRLDEGATPVLLRVGAAEPPSTFGTYVAAAWDAGPAPTDGGFDEQGDSDWIALSRVTHPAILGVLDAGTLVATAGATAGPSGPHRSSGAGATVQLAAPLPFAALAWIEGATLGTLMRNALLRSGRALGPGAALAVGAGVAGALAWIHDALVRDLAEPRAVWHGRLDEQHVFVSTEGACRLAMPIRRFPHEYCGGMLTRADLEAMQAEDRRAPRIDVPAPLAGKAGDLFRLGALLFEVVTGRRPDPGHGPAAEALVAFDPSVPPQLTECIQSLLAVAPERRFASAMLDAVHTEHFSLRARVEHAMERAYCRIASHQIADYDLFFDPEEKSVEGAQRGCDDVLAAAFLAGMLEAQEATPEEQVMELEGQVATRASLQAALAALYPHEREVIHLLYEKGRRERVTLDDVAREIGVHESTAQRRHVAALRKLREQLAKRGITRSIPLGSLAEAGGDREG